MIVSVSLRNFVRSKFWHVFHWQGLPVEFKYNFQSLHVQLRTEAMIFTRWNYKAFEILSTLHCLVCLDTVFCRRILHSFPKRWKITKCVHFIHSTYTWCTKQGLDNTVSWHNCNSKEEILAHARGRDCGGWGDSFASFWYINGIFVVGRKMLTLTQKWALIWVKLLLIS